jgi:hypothetical protein
VSQLAEVLVDGSDTILNLTQDDGLGLSASLQEGTGLGLLVYPPGPKGQYNAVGNPLRFAHVKLALERFLVNDPGWREAVSWTLV